MQYPVVHPLMSPQALPVSSKPTVTQMALVKLCGTLNKAKIVNMEERFVRKKGSWQGLMEKKG